MKKMLCFLLSIMLVCGIFIIPAAAVDGPFPDSLEVIKKIEAEEIDPETAEYSALVAMGIDYENFQIYQTYFFPSEEGVVIPSAFKGMSYDLETNTLTLNNVRSAETILMATDMGDDFKIEVIGYNEISEIISTGNKRGASVSIIGEGELILNKESTAMSDAPFTIEAGGTAAFFHADATVDLKFHVDEYFGGAAVIVNGSSLTDPAQVFRFEGTVKGGEVVSEAYKEKLYEKIDAYSYDWDIVEGCDAIFTREDTPGVYYAGFESFNYETFTVDGYEIYPVEYDENLGCYVAPKYTSKENPYLFTDYQAAGYVLVDALQAPTGFNRFLVPMGTTAYSIALDESGNKFAFETFEYYDEEVGGNITEITVYRIFENPIVGYVVQEISGKDNLDGLTPQVVEEKDCVRGYINGNFVYNDGGSTAPAKVTLVSAKNVADGVQITWKATKGAEKYRIYRKTGSGSWKKLDDVGANKTSFVDKTAKSGTKYTYTVKGYNFVGWGIPNKTGIKVTCLKAPAVSLKNVKNGVQLKWAKVKGATKYTIYRKLKNADNWTILKKNVTALSYVDETAKSGKIYKYAVRANSSTVSSAIIERQITCLKTPKLLKAYNNKAGIRVNWDDTKGAEEYIVYRKLAGGKKWLEVGETAKTGFTDKNVKNGKTYIYNVRAVKGKYRSALSTKGIEIKCK